MRYVAPDAFFSDAAHRVGVLLVGCGGTGSQVLMGLARMDHALRALGHQGLFVVAVDDDRVTPSNLGRQVFAAGDLGQSKAAVLVTRVNRYFGLDWESRTERIGTELDFKALGLDDPRLYPLAVSCVDSGAARAALGAALATSDVALWLDFGNRRADGQVILGRAGHEPREDRWSSHKNSREADDVVAWLPNVVDLYPDIAGADEPDEPSCSMAEALERQDLFVNSVLADYGLHILWRLLRRGEIDTHGAFVSLDALRAAPLRVCPEAWAGLGWTHPHPRHREE